MTLAELMIKISCDTSEAEKGINKTEQKTGKLGKSMGKFAKVVGGAFVAAGAAVGKLALDATKAYANYEQLVGGVETLFGAGGKSLKEYQKQIGVTAKSLALAREEAGLFSSKGNASSDKEIKASVESYNKLIAAQNEVMNNAKQAYKTAGMDMNSYMETVTSFSASLIKSLGGDTLAAAKAADQAVIDMSDNANKMGTDMASIENAYKGFSKQNYTMLDNLKLGYGGTRSEMQRLLKDAQKITGKKYDLKNLNDVYEAIHVIQTELGITGTTAKEASTTIQGSLGMMKASWMNLKLAIADPNGNVGEAIAQLVDSAKTFAHNAAPVFGQALRGIGSAIKELAPVLSSELPGLIGDLLPDLTQAAVSLVSGLTKTIIENAPMVIDGFGQMFQAVGEEMKKSDNPIIQAAGHVISFIGDLIRDPQGTLTKAWESIQSTAAGVWDAIKKAAQTAWSTLSDWFNDNIINPVAEWVEKKREDIENAVKTMGTWLNENIVQPVAEWIEKKRDEIETAVTTMGAWLSKNIVQPVAEWIEKKRQGIIDAVNSLGEWVNANIVKPVVEFVAGTLNAVFKAIASIPKAITVAVNFVKKVIDQTGKNLQIADENVHGDDWTVEDAMNDAQHNAKGNWNVPYNNFPALLHRGEMVLTASQARRYREGEMGGFDASALANTIVSAIRQGMNGATVNSYLDGKLVSDGVSRMLGSDMTARRFA